MNLGKPPVPESRALEQRPSPIDGATFEALRFGLAAAARHALIVIDSREWIFPLMPSLVAARCRGVDIHLHYCAPTLCDRPSRRLDLLEALGCSTSVLAREHAQPRAVVYDPLTERSNGALVQNDGDAARWRALVGSREEHAVKAVYGELCRSCCKLECPVPTPQFERLRLRSMAEALHRVPFYRQADIFFVRVDVSTSLPIAAGVRPFKVRQAAMLRRFFLDQGLTPYEPASVRLLNGGEHLFVPPVLEIHGNDLYVAEGHSRIFAALMMGHTRLVCAIIHGLSEAPASNPCHWGEVECTEEPRDPWFYRGRDRQSARHIETWTHIPRPKSQQ